MQTNEFPKVAVVILCWNGRKFLEQFIPPLLKTTYSNAEFYVADNKSTDDSVAYLRQNFPLVNIIELQENLGFPGGYNAALKQVDADYYVLLNQDVEVTPNWIEPVIELMLSKPDCGAAQPKLRAFNNKTEFEYAGAAGGYMDGFGYAFCRGRIFDTMETDTGQYDTEEQIFWASGAALFIKAELYHKLGGLDPFFFAHMEEIDLCWRLKSAGYSIWYSPKSVVYHVGGGSLPQGNPRKTFLNFRNNLIIIVKNETLFRVLTIMPFRMVLDFVALLKSLSEGNRADAAAISRSHRNFFANIGSIWRSRQETKRLVKAARIGPVNWKGHYRGSVVFGFFIRGFTKFSELIPSRFI